MDRFNRRILVVDDNQAIHADFRKIFCTDAESKVEAAEAVLFGEAPRAKREVGFELEFASQGQEALDLVNRALKAGRPYAMAFMDVRMPPGWDGIETISRIWQVDPDMQMAICTAFSDYSLEKIAAILRNSAKFVILKKPFDIVEVVQLATAFTEKWNLSRGVQERTRRLQESEQRYRFLADSVPGIVWTARPDGGWEYANRRQQQYSGKGFEQVRDWNWKEIVHPDDLSATLERWNRSLQTGAEYEMEFRLKRADNTWRWQLGRALPLRNAEGKIVQWFGTCTDIDDQKHLEALLRQSQADLERRVAERTEELAGAHVRFEHLLRSSPAIIYSKKADGQGELTFVSQNITAVLGHHPGQFIEDPQAWGQLVHPDDTGTVRGHRFKLLVGEHHAVEYRFKHKDGSYRWLHDDGRVIRDAAGAPVEIVGSCTDITERKKMEEALQAAKEQLEQRVVERTAELQAAVLKTQRALEELAHQKFALDQHAIVAVTDVEGRITYVNNKFCAVSRYSREGLVGQDHRVLNSGFHAREFFAGMYRTISKGQVWHGEIRNRTKDNAIYWLNTTIVPFLGTGGKPQQYIAISTDITELKSIEQALRENEQRFRQLAESLPQLIWTCQPDGPCDFLSAQWVAYTGVPASEQMGYNWLKQVHPDDQARLKDAWESAVAAGARFHTEFRIRGHDGGYRWFETSAMPLRNSEGRIVKWFGSNTDVEEYKRAQAEISKLNAELEQRVTKRTAELQQAVGQLAYERDLLETLMGNSPDYIYFKDRDSRFLRCSNTLAARFGRRTEEVVGKTDFDFFDEEHARPAFEDEQEIIRTGKPLVGRVEKEVIKNGGQVTWALTNKMPLRNKAGEVIGTFGISRDITAIKEAEQGRQLMELQLRQAQKLEAIGQLAAGIAHEINTPTQYVGDNTRFLKDSFDSIARALQSYEGLLRAAKANTITPELIAQMEQTLAANDLGYLFEQIPAAIRESLEGVDRVAKIVRAMKEFSHPGGKEKVPADLNKAIETTVTVARNEWKYVADLNFELDPKLPAVPCFLGEFNQVILNLIVNAAHAIGDVVKQNPGSKGVITISSRHDGEFVEVRVKDTGTGISEANRPRIFEPFFTTKDVGKGTGQGLSIIYGSIVKKHGGTVTFESEVGKGTTFILRLPINSQPSATKPTGKENQGAQYENASSGPMANQ
jgi:PAS domain S-box-containing protein